MEKLDEEQLELGSSDRFWTLIAERRREKTLSRAELEERLHEQDRLKVRDSSPSK